MIGTDMKRYGRYGHTHPAVLKLYFLCTNNTWGFPVTQTVKNLPAVQETLVQYLGWKDPLKKGIATHSSTVAWRIPQRSLVGYSPWGRKDSDMSERLAQQHNDAGQLLFVIVSIC